MIAIDSRQWEHPNDAYVIVTLTLQVSRNFQLHEFQHFLMFHMVGMVIFVNKLHIGTTDGKLLQFAACLRYTDLHCLD